MLTLTHTYNDAIEVGHDGQPLFRYVYKPHTIPTETPKPYFHPMYTLDGNEVTCFRPHDHVWHKGLCMTIAHLSGQNFWGGATYIHSTGYRQLDNNGRMEHDTWDEIRCEEDTVTFHESLSWHTLADEHWIAEKRQMQVSEVNTEAGYWNLDFHFELTNVSGQVLEIGSPTTQGRPLAGYGGLFWRGPRSFRGGQVLGAGGLEGQEIMGQATSWLAFIGKHDGVDAQSTLMFLDHPNNLRYPNKWFVRSDPFACASFAFMFDEVYLFQPEEILVLNYRVVIGNGAWEREKIDQMATDWQHQR